MEWIIAPPLLRSFLAHFRIFSAPTKVIGGKKQVSEEQKQTLIHESNQNLVSGAALLGLLVLQCFFELMNYSSWNTRVFLILVVSIFGLAGTLSALLFLALVKGKPDFHRSLKDLILVDVPLTLTPLVFLFLPH